MRNRGIRDLELFYLNFVWRNRFEAQQALWPGRLGPGIWGNGSAREFQTHAEGGYLAADRVIRTEYAYHEQRRAQADMSAARTQSWQFHLLSGAGVGFAGMRQL